MIEEQWKKYALGFPEEASDFQKNEMRKAFYCGASVLFYGILKQASDTKNLNEVTDEDFALMDDIEAELKGFLDEVIIPDPRVRDA